MKTLLFKCQIVGHIYLVNLSVIFYILSGMFYSAMVYVTVYICLFSFFFLDIYMF